MSRISKLKLELAKLLASFMEIKTDKAVLTYPSEEEIAVGFEVYVINEDGEYVTPEDGEYKTEDGKVITGKESELLSASSAAIINVLKEITNIPDEVYLLSPSILEGIFKTKQYTSYRTSYCLNVQEVLIALSICSSTNPIIEKIISQIKDLRGLEAHSTYIIEQSEMNVLKNLGINLTCEPKM